MTYIWSMRVEFDSSSDMYLKVSSGTELIGSCIDGDHASGWPLLKHPTRSIRTTGEITNDLVVTNQPSMILLVA